MVAILKALKLSDDEKALLSRLNREATAVARVDGRNDAYYEGAQRLEQIGLAVPPELRRFETVVNWPRTDIDELERRLDVKALLMPGEDMASKVLREGWESNNLDSESPLHHRETMILGRGFVSVGTNPDDKEHPLITVEPPRQMVCVVEQASRRMLGAARTFREWDGTRRKTLLLPESTIWLAATRSGWEIVDRDDHGLGRVPLVLFLNRRRPGNWRGVSEMTDVIPLANAAARALTNLQLAQEGLAVPTRYIFGVDKDKMVDPKTGKAIPTWEAYYTALMAHSNANAKAGQFQAADLKNFTETVNHYGTLVASVTGLPLSYFTGSTVNPAAEGAVRAHETRFVKNIERKQVEWGDGWGWVMGLYERFRTGEWLDGNRIHTEWHDAGTPTFAQRSDAIQKLAGGVPILSRQGAWDELGWSEPRKQREEQYFEQESHSGYLGLIEAKDAAAAEVTDADADAPAPGA